MPATFKFLFVWCRWCVYTDGESGATGLVVSSSVCVSNTLLTSGWHDSVLNVMSDYSGGALKTDEHTTAPFCCTRVVEFFGNYSGMLDFYPFGGDCSLRELRYVQLRLSSKSRKAFNPVTTLDQKG